LTGDLRPRAIDFFSEPIPVFPAWPNARCGYLQFSAAYDVPGQKAREAGWRYLSMPAGHFHMLVDPAGLANALLELTSTMGIASSRRSPDRPTWK
jgi:hypothetical protein